MENSSKKPRVLVTGASGMLGKVLVPFLSERCEVLGLSKRGVEGHRRCDLASAKEVSEVFASFKPHLVIHAAAYSDVDGCEREPKLAFDANAVSAKNLADACAAQGVPWIYVSTDYVFDGTKNAPYAEHEATGPVNIYGMSKLAGEHHALSGPVHSAIVRTSWLFGAENPLNFVNAILARLKKDKTVSVLDDQTDSPTSVKDLSEALLTIGEHLMAADPKSPSHEIYHVCNAGPATRLEMTRCMNEWLGLGVKVEKAERSQIQNRLAIRPAYVVMSTARYEKLSGKKLRPWKESLKEFVRDKAPCAS